MVCCLKNYEQFNDFYIESLYKKEYCKYVHQKIKDENKNKKGI